MDHSNTSRRHRSRSCSMGQTANHSSSQRRCRPTCNPFESTSTGNHRSTSDGLQTPSPVLSLGRLLDAIFRLDSTEVWMIVCGSLEDVNGTSNKAIDNCDSTYPQVLEDKKSTASPRHYQNQNEFPTWMPRVIMHVEGEDDVSLDLTWDGSYSVDSDPDVYRIARRQQQLARQRRNSKATKKRASSVPKYANSAQTKMYESGSERSKLNSKHQHISSRRPSKQGDLPGAIVGCPTTDSSKANMTIEGSLAPTASETEPSQSSHHLSVFKIFSNGSGTPKRRGLRLPNRFQRKQKRPDQVTTNTTTSPPVTNQ